MRLLSLTACTVQEFCSIEDGEVRTCRSFLFIVRQRSYLAAASRSARRSFFESTAHIASLSFTAAAVSSRAGCSRASSASSRRRALPSPSGAAYGRIRAFRLRVRPCAKRLTSRRTSFSPSAAVASSTRRRPSRMARQILIPTSGISGRVRKSSKRACLSASS